MRAPVSHLLVESLALVLFLSESCVRTAMADEAPGLPGKLGVPAVLSHTNPGMSRDGQAPVSTGPSGADRDARQGGEDIDSATPIPAIPFSSSGTTVGYANDYAETCGGSSGTAPDVVYVYSPAQDEVVDISLCGNTAYDSKLYVYEDVATPGSPVACNDDTCNSPSYIMPYLSHVFGLTLLGGHDYYIVVDGYGADAGTYTIDITPPMVPPANDDCANAIPVSGPFPQTVTGSTYLATEDCTEAAAYESVWYRLSLPYVSNEIRVGFCGSNDAIWFYTGTILPSCGRCNQFIVYSFGEWVDCPDGDTHPVMGWMGVEGPDEFYIPVSLYPVSNYEVTFDVFETCVDAGCPGLVAPTRFEAEPPCESTNFGCELGINPVFEGLECGDVVCGTTWASGLERDGDWYDILLIEDAELTVSLAAGCVPAKLSVFDAGSGDCSDHGQVFADSLFIASGATDSLTVCLPAGSYYLATTPQLHNGYPCLAEEPFHYSLRVACAPCPPPNLCDDVTDLGLFTMDSHLDAEAPGQSHHDGGGCPEGVQSPGRDHIYRIELEAAAELSIEMLGEGDADEVLLLLGDCADPFGSCLGAVNAQGGGPTPEHLGTPVLAAGEYYIVADFAGPDEGVAYSLDITFPPVGVEERRRPGIELQPNLPNPFNPVTRIPFALDKGALVALEIYSIAGEKVETLAHGWFPAGTHAIAFDGSALPSGIYLCTLRASGMTQTRRMLLIR